MKQLKKTILTLVALLALTTGAWADETLLTTITPTGDGTYSETTAGAVTVTPAGSCFYSGSSYGWRWDSYGSLTVTANEGYTITICVFIQQGKNQSVTISEAPFALNFEEWLCLENYSMDGVSSIEVYGTAPAPSGPEVAWNKTSKTGTFTMPGGNVTLEPEYYPQATVADGGVTAADADARATTDDPLVKVDATKLTGAKKLMYFVSNSGTTAPAYDAEGWTDQLPTAEGFTQQGIVYVWYYPVGTDEGVDGATATYSDGDICLQSITARIAAAPTYAVTFAEGTDPNEWTASPAADVTKGQTVTVTYTGSKKVIGVKAEKKAAPAETTVTLTTGEIGDLTSWGSNSKTINGITIAVSGDAHFFTTGYMEVSAYDTETGDPISSTGTYTFTSSVGKIKQIDINHNGGKWWGSGAGWPGSYQVYHSSTFTWSGTPAASVTLNGSGNDMDNCTFDVSSIVFTLEPTN